MKGTLKACLVGMGLLSTLAAAQQQTFNVYGFADASMEYVNNATTFNKQFVGQDTFNFGLTHANIYFGFEPNEHLKALVEVGFASQKNLESYGIGSGIRELIGPTGEAMTDAQIVGMVVQTNTQSILDSIVDANGLPDIATLEAAMPGTTAGVQAQVQAGVEAELLPALAQARGTASSGLRTTTAHTVTIQRAYFDLILNDGINLRMGQFITPAGIWNEDHASPVILTVRQPIQTSITPIFPESQTGLMVYGRQFLGDHDLTYNGYISTGRSGPLSAQSMTGSGYKSSVDNLGDLAVGGHVALKLDMLKGINLGASGMMGTLRKKTLSQDASLDVVELLQGNVVPYGLAYNESVNTEEREFIFGLDTKIKVNKFTVQGEYNHRLIDNELKKGTTTMQGFYTLLAYELPFLQSFSVTPYVMYESVNWADKDAGTNTLGDEDVNGFDMTFAGLNFTLYNNFHVKVEYARLQLRLSDEPENFPTHITEKDMYSDVVSTQFSVAF